MRGEYRTSVKRSLIAVSSIGHVRQARRDIDAGARDRIRRRDAHAPDQGQGVKEHVDSDDHCESEDNKRDKCDRGSHPDAVHESSGAARRSIACETQIANIGSRRGFQRVKTRFQRPKATPSTKPSITPSTRASLPITRGFIVTLYFQGPRKLLNAGSKDPAYNLACRAPL